ncbi:DegT/DnrJ/EryC1/StrS aminotransferase family protein [Alphaproteobacteria bacterium]|nr:DegT/DnrJ/EryC1/StrS aminotransferase family protein [Alphaproteobacteria bacterium]
MIPVYKPSLSGKEKEYVSRCFDSTWISSKGEYIDQFEKEFSKFIGVEHATTVSNGTVALHLALEAVGVGPGDEVIVPTFTYVASVNTILQAGAKPIFADSLEETWQVDPKDIKQKITTRTKAIMAVHLYGQSCEMEQIFELCEEHNLLLIEDCAEAFGTLYKKQHVGTFGDVATFSFFGNKTITTGEGGMVVTNNTSVYNKACHLKNQGVSSTRQYWHDQLAYNYRMTNICAAIGLAQLENAENILKKKRQIALWYDDLLVDLPLTSHNTVEKIDHSYWMYSILLLDESKRDPLREHLEKKGVETRPLFFPAHTMPHLATGQTFPVAEKISKGGMNLPSYPDLSKNDVKYICDGIKNYFSSTNIK